MTKTTRIILVISGIIGLIAVISAAFIIFYAQKDRWVCENGEWVKYGEPKEEKPGTKCGEDEEEDSVKGAVIIDIADYSMTVRNKDGKEREVLIGEGAKIFGMSNDEKDLDYLHRGFIVNISGIKENGKIRAGEIRVEKEPNIIVYSPQPNDAIGLPLVLKGEARVFESTFNYRVKDATGKIIFESFAMAASPDMGIYGPFEVHVNYPEPETDTGAVEVFEYSAKDGSEINKVIIPVSFADVNAMNVKVYFPNTKLDPEMMDCSKVFAVERRVPVTLAAARVAVTELLKGPDTVEAREGYISSINSGVKIQKLTIEDGVAKIDFDQMLEQSVGGSCRVASIRSQITETLKQFPTVSSVVISIDGRTEDILQP